MSDQILQKLTSQIREIRTERKMSMADVAMLAFNDANRRAQIYKIENEQTGMTVQTMQKIFKALNCSLVIVPNEKIKEVNKILEIR